MSAAALDQFAAITVQVLAADGIDDYLPTIVDFETSEVSVIEGIPDDVEHTIALIETVERKELKDANFAFGVRTGDGEVVAGVCSKRLCLFERIVRRDDGFDREPSGTPPWWPAAL